MLYAFLMSPIRAAFLAHLILLDLITLLMFDGEDKVHYHVLSSELMNHLKI